jgi:Glucose inhibited division protein A
MGNRSQPPIHILSGNLSTFRGAGLAGVAASLAYCNLGEFVALFLAIVAEHLDHLGKMACMLRIDCRQSRKRIATGNELKHRIGALSHARVLHLIHAQTMPEAVIAGRHTFNAGFLESLVFWRMHLLLAALGEGL